MKTSILLIAAVALCAPLFAAESGIPRVPFRDAVLSGEEFLRTNKVDLSRYHSSDATLARHPDGQHYWDIRWRSTVRTNEFILLRVEMDRKVSLLVPSHTTNALQAVFERAIGAKGADFAEFEHILVTNSLAVTVLKSNLNHPDPIGRLLAKYALLWHEGGEKEFTEMLEYLGGREERMRRTPARYPRSDGVANTLSENHGSRVAELLAVGLVKNPDWPEWEGNAVILYLGKQKVFATTDALIRFAAETEDRELRKEAVKTIRHMADPELRAKLRAERNRLLGKGKELPRELVEMETEL